MYHIFTVTGEKDTTIKSETYKLYDLTLLKKTSKESNLTNTALRDP